jgi:YD repeat-containing protein
MRRAHRLCGPDFTLWRLPKRFVRLTSLSVCLVLILTSLGMIPFSVVKGKGASSQGQGNQEPDNGKARKVTPEPPQMGPPSGTLPDLDEVKSRHASEPEAPAPVPSTMRSKHKPLESRHGRKVGDPLPRATVDSVSRPSADLMAAIRTGSPARSQSSTTNSSLPNNLLAWNRDDAILDLFTAPAFHSSNYSALLFLRYASPQSYQAISDSPFSLSLASANDAAFNLPLAPMPYGNGYTYSRSITINHAQVPNTDRSNFPLLISGTYPYLKTVANGGDVQNSNGYDVIFTSDAGCATKLNHEVETYNGTTGAVNYWVKVPTVSHTTSDTVIYMCYRNASITTDQSNKTAVWDANYKGVWHLPNGTSLTANDSTSNGVNGTITSTSAATGQVDGCGSFDGANSKIDMGNASALDGMTALTISAWIKPNSLTGANRILTKWMGSFLVGTRLGSGDVLRLAVQKTGGGVSIFDSPASTLTVGSWQHVVVTWSQPNTVTISVNGTAKTVTIAQDQNVTSTGPSSTVVQIGSPSDGVGNHFDGLIDEVRMSNVVRSADWIKTEYNNQSSPSTFYTISAASGNQPPVANTGGPYSGIIGQNVPFNGGSSYDPDGSISSYSWSFGDGGTGSNAAPTRAYGSAGTYNVTLTVTDNLGAQASASTTITITSSSSDQFVQNFLQWGLARAPQGDEALYWSDIMRAAYPQGQTSMLIAMREFGMTVFESAEYAGRNRSDHDYVYDLYKTYLMREPDQAGWNFWTGQVPHAGRESVRHAFDLCGEFSAIMSTLTASGAPTSAVSSLSTARVDPFNQSGNQLQARDCEWSLPLLSLPGRAGLDLGLGLSYSSLVWTRSGPYVYFDQDNGSASPGFRLGFATIQGPYFDAQVGRNAYLLITSSGHRVELRQTGTSNVYEAGDSSYLQLIVNGSSLLLRTTDGTQITFGGFENAWQATAIEDRNGNLLNVSYDWRGDITNITDTVGRVITFNYDGNANLISITQNGRALPWVTFGWTNVTMQPNFGGEVVGTHTGEVIPVVAQVGLSDGSRHTFEYTGAGQVNLIRRYTSDNVQRSYLAYDYAPASDYIPRLTQTRVTADNWTGLNGVPAEVVTQFSDPGDARM